MNNSPKPSSITEFRAPALLRGAALFCLFFTPILTAISLMAWWVEGATIGLWTAPIWLAMTIYWLWQWRIWAQRMQLHADRLEILTPFANKRTIHYTQITALHMERDVLHVITQQENPPIQPSKRNSKRISIRGDANTLALMTVAMEEVVPALRAARESPPSLPIVVKAQRQSILIISVFGLLIAALGIGLTHAAIDDVEMESRGFAIGFGVVMIGMGGVLLYWLLVTFVWRYRFDKDTIEARHTFRRERYHPSLLRQIEMKQQTVTNRGITRTLHTLEMQFADDQKFVIQPGAQNYPFDYAEAHEKVLLEKLLQQLTAAYRNELQNIQPDLASAVSKNTTLKGESPPLVSRSELDPANLPWPDVTPPDYAFQLYSVPANLTVSILNYGERQPGAETIEIRLSASVEGENFFYTTNGNALFSQSGSLLLLHDSFLPIVIDTATLRAWHYKIADRTFLLSPKWDGERLIGSTLGYGKRIPDAEPFGPWSKDDIIQHWQQGLGSWVKTTPAHSPLAEDQTSSTSRRRSRTSTVNTIPANTTPANIPAGMSEHLWRRLNFIELNPDWVMLDDGTVFAAKEDYVLPRQLGEHVVGGKVQLVDQPQPRFAAFVMDSAIGAIATLYTKQDGEWRRVIEPVAWMKPHVNFAGFVGVSQVGASPVGASPVGASQPEDRQ